MATENRTAIIFSRCSSSGALEGRQDTTRQVEDLQDYAARNNYKVEKIFEEHLSGNTKLEHRVVLCSAISFAKENHIHSILCTELSRMGRSDDVLYVVKECKDAGINIFFQKENLNIFMEDGKPNPFLNIFISCLSFAASSELEAIQMRLKSGRDKYIRDGGKLGKPKGAGVKTKEMLATEYRSVIKNLRSGQSVRNTSKITGVSPSTVQRIKKEFNL
ncbi:MAG: recombinase family protein [Bacteroidaceae bacterium]|nr:recombinase family protein [Bacteroidaceae bacterium]